MVVWTQIDIRRRTIAQRSVETNIRAFLAKGGDARALYAAQIKSLSAIIRTGVNQTALVSQLRGLLRTIAQEGGIDQTEVDQLQAQLGAAPDLGQKGERKARRQSWGLFVYAVLIFLLVVVGTAVALQFVHP